MTTIFDNAQAVQSRMEAALTAAGRPVDAARLLAVSKTWPASALRAAWVAGLRAFGENYVQEAVTKITELADLAIEWHFIGPVQSNKTRDIAENFAWVHGVDRLKIAQRLSAQRPGHLPDLQICLQVNVSNEASKSGVSPQELPALAQAVARLPRLQLRGLMAVPEATEDTALLRNRFALLRQLRDQLNAQGLQLDTLSMGMSHDYPLAIAEGATLVRVGSAIFGQRNYPNTSPHADSTAHPTTHPGAH